MRVVHNYKCLINTTLNTISFEFFIQNKRPVFCAVFNLTIHPIPTLDIRYFVFYIPGIL